MSSFLGGGGGGGGGGTPANPATSVQFNNAGAFGGSQRFEWDGSALNLGRGTDATGLLKLIGTTSGVVTLSVVDAAGTWTMKLPTTAGTNGFSLTTDGFGNTAWSNVAGSSGITIGTSVITGGTTQRLLYDNAGLVGETSGVTWDGANVVLASSVALSWNNDVFLFRDSANTFAQRNGVNPQIFHQYLTFTDAFNYERLSYTTDANGIAFKFEAAGTGVARAITIAGGGTTPGSIVCWADGHIDFLQQNVVNFWSIDNTGNFICGVTGGKTLRNVGDIAFASGSVGTITHTQSITSDNGVFLDLRTVTNGGGQIRLDTTAVKIVSSGIAFTWTFDCATPYNLFAVTDGLSSIGKPGANRPLNLYLSNDIYTGDASFMHRTTTAWTNGAAAQIGTLTNAPAAGNPTKWIPVDDNGTTRFIPAW